MKNKKIVMVKKIIKIIGTVFFSALLIGTVYFVGSMIGWIRRESPDVPTESLHEWVSRIDHIDSPNQTEVIAEGYGTGNLGQGNMELYSYGYYWVLKSELTKEELITYYQPFIDEANIETIGTETVLDYQKLETNDRYDVYYHIDELFEDVEALEPQELDENQYYVIYAYKRGRWMGVN